MVKINEIEDFGDLSIQDLPGLDKETGIRDASVPISRDIRTIAKYALTKVKPDVFEFLTWTGEMGVYDQAWVDNGVNACRIKFDKISTKLTDEELLQVHRIFKRFYPGKKVTIGRHNTHERQDAFIPRDTRNCIVFKVYK